MSCAVNPACGREKEYGIEPSREKRKVMIVGGGIAGMEAARVAAIRGHHVDLYESGKALGGVVIAGGMPDFKKDDHALIAWYEDQFKDLGVKVHLNTKVDADAVAAAKADTVIVATGATAKMLSIPCAKNVF